VGHLSTRDQGTNRPLAGALDPWFHLTSVCQHAAAVRLGTAIVYVYPRSARIAVPVILLGSGLGVCLFGRASYHIVASGLAHGLRFFLFALGVLRRDRPAMALSMLVFFLYGGMLWGICPQESGGSFESHFFGAVTGLALAFLLRHHDPVPPEKTYDWEDRAEDDPVIGNQWRER